LWDAETGEIDPSKAYNLTPISTNFDGLVPTRPEILHKPLISKKVEARGVEPLS